MCNIKCVFLAFACLCSVSRFFLAFFCCCQQDSFDLFLNVFYGISVRCVFFFFSFDSQFFCILIVLHHRRRLHHYSAQSQHHIYNPIYVCMYLLNCNVLCVAIGEICRLYSKFASIAAEIHSYKRHIQNSHVNNKII